MDSFNNLVIVLVYVWSLPDILFWKDTYIYFEKACRKYCFVKIDK